MAISFRELLRKRVVVFDGAMGTSIQTQNLTSADFGGSQYEGCNDYLSLVKPGVIEQIHADYLQAGCDVIETNTFGASALVLREYGLEDQAYAINHAAAQLAKKVAGFYSGLRQPRFVAGSVGSGTRLPSLEQITFDEIHEMVHTQVSGLVDGGIDIIIIETCQDILQTKAALTASLQVLAEKRKDIPIIVQVTIEKDAGAMLIGTDIGAVVTILESYPVDVIGLNCGTGPDNMREPVRFLSKYSPRQISVQPNAGIPENVDGVALYNLQPDEFAKDLLEFVQQDKVNIVGGCCGTTPVHLKALVNAVRGRMNQSRTVSFVPAVASLYQSVALQQNPPPLIIGERVNANGSKHFRELLLQDKYDSIVEIGREQEKDGAYMLDVCTAYVGRDEKKDMTEVVRRFNQQISLPLMIDSTDAEVIEAALKITGGRAIINSVNLEDGEERLAQILNLCKKYGAAVVALTIDEEGMALTSGKKVAIAKRIHKLAIQKYSLRSHDLIFDPLTFTLANPEYSTAAQNTIAAIKQIKQELPQCFTILGISNVSYGMNLYARKILNSVFLYHAVQAGLDAAIVNYRHILPLNRIPENERELAQNVVLNRKINDESALNRFMTTVGHKKVTKEKPVETNLTIGEILTKRIVEGNKENLDIYLQKALEQYTPLEIINSFLLNGMKEVGELFGCGKMQLPYVLQAAEVMKTAVNFLEPYMEQTEGTEKGRVLLATVKGDVHDIGKNLVEIILSNNGYKIYNLGIKIPVDKIMQSARKYDVDAIGLSGLLVKSTAIMKENLEEMSRSGFGHIPVIVGGAALTEKFVKESLSQSYPGSVFYAADAFAGLRILDQIRASNHVQEINSNKKGDVTFSISERKKGSTHKSNIKNDNISIPQIPFYGTRIVENIPLDEIYPYINEMALFRARWQYRKGMLSDEQYEQVKNETITPVYKRLKQDCKKNCWLKPKVVYGYFYCQSENDDVIIYREDQRTEWMRFHFPRQNRPPLLCIADYFVPKDSGRMDVAAFQLVTVGHTANKIARKLYEDDQYSEYLFLHGFSVEVAEALAELWHKKIRRELGIDGRDAPDIQSLFRQKYQGARFSFGYSACPNLADQKKLFELLQPQRIDVQLTEQYMLDPEQSTSALIVHHPQAKYFNVK